MTDQGFTIDMSNPATRRKVALQVLRGRFKIAIQMHRTDSFALDSARGWALKDAERMDAKTPVPFHTMKQALAWVESEIEKYKTEEAKDAQSAGSPELD